MFRSIYLGLITCFCCVNMAYADYSVPVGHTHNNREHSHQLPKEGLDHRHGIGPLGKAIRKQNTVIYSSTTTVPNQPRRTYTPTRPVQPTKPVTVRMVQ